LAIRVDGGQMAVKLKHRATMTAVLLDVVFLGCNIIEIVFFN